MVRRVDKRGGRKQEFFLTGQGRAYLDQHWRDLFHDDTQDIESVLRTVVLSLLAGKKDVQTCRGFLDHLTRLRGLGAEKRLLEAGHMKGQAKSASQAYEWMRARWEALRLGAESDLLATIRNTLGKQGFGTEGGK
jgi:hypothetical protein